MSGLHDALEAYFRNGGPDTPISTVWHDGEEYWEAPAADIRALLAAQPAEPARSVEIPDREAIDQWIREEIERAIAFHAATKGSGHQAGEMCDGWSALTEAMQQMHDDVHELFDTAAAVPQPVDREALIQVVAEYIDDLDNVPSMGTPADHLERRAVHVADAVLALLNGSEKPS